MFLSKSLTNFLFPARLLGNTFAQISLDLSRSKTCLKLGFRPGFDKVLDKSADKSRTSRPTFCLKNSVELLRTC